MITDLSKEEEDEILRQMEDEYNAKPVVPLEIKSEAESLEAAEKAAALLVGPPSRESFEYLMRFLAWRYSRKPVVIEVFHHQEWK
jgi:hypothetical protein